jgi:hypothetical protein
LVSIQHCVRISSRSPGSNFKTSCSEACSWRSSKIAYITPSLRPGIVEDFISHIEAEKQERMYSFDISHVPWKTFFLFVGFYYLGSSEDWNYNNGFWFRLD